LKAIRTVSALSSPRCGIINQGMKWCPISAVSSGAFGDRRRQSRVMFPTVAKPYLLLLRMDTPYLHSEATVPCLFQGFITGQWPLTFENRPILLVCARLLVRTMLQSLGLQRDHYPIWDTAGAGRMGKDAYADFPPPECKQFILAFGASDRNLCCK
jgi:hypothetical protein